MDFSDRLNIQNFNKKKIKKPSIRKYNSLDLVINQSYYIINTLTNYLFQQNKVYWLMYL